MKKMESFLIFYSWRSMIFSYNSFPSARKLTHLKGLMKPRPDIMFII